MHPEIASQLQHIYLMSTSDLSRSASGFGVVTHTSQASSVSSRTSGHAHRDRSRRASSVMSTRSVNPTQSTRVCTPADKKQANHEGYVNNDALPALPSESLLRQFNTTMDEQLQQLMSLVTKHTEGSDGGSDGDSWKSSQSHKSVKSNKSHQSWRSDRSQSRQPAGGRGPVHPRDLPKNLKS